MMLARVRTIVPPVTARPRWSLRLLVAACCLWLAGCAGPFGLFRSGAQTTPAFRDATLSLQDASGSVVPGTSTKAEVLARLGSATVVRFDSAYEVWVYAAKSADGEPARSGELVILFAPDGVVKKVRVRPPTLDQPGLS